MQGGLRESPLKMNEGLGACEVWNETAIQARADKLALNTNKVWPIPQLEFEEFEAC